MVTIYSTTPQSVYGLSTDSKPTTVSNGASFIEVDTADVYFFDEENKLWIKA